MTTTAIREVTTTLHREVERLLSYNTIIGFDIETTGFNPRKNKLVLVSLKASGKRGLYIDCRYESKDYLYNLLSPIFDNGVTIVGHNIAFDLGWMLTYLGLAPSGVKIYDTMLVELDILGIGLSDANKHRETSVNLAAVAERHGLAGVSKEKRSWFIDLDKRPEWDLPFPQEQLDYARQDVSVLHPLLERQREKVRQMQLSKCASLESAAIPATVVMSHWGVLIDTDIWREEVAVMRIKAQELEQQVHEALDVYVLDARHKREQPIRESYNRWKCELDRRLLAAKQDYESIPKKERNIGNWSLVKEQVLAHYYAHYGKRSKPADSKTGVNLGSRLQLMDGFAGLGVNVEDVKEDTLQPYAVTKPAIRTYLDWKQINTHLTKYDGDFLDRVVEYTDGDRVHGRIYADWQQKGAGSGRRSCKNPNLQNIPAKGIGSGLRRAIVPSPGYKFVIADFSNIELRIVAERSNCEFLLEAFRKGIDVHAFTAAMMFGIQVLSSETYKADAMLDLNGVLDSELKEYTESHNAIVAGRELENTSQRRVAKTINYMLLYGGGVVRLAGELGIAEEDAKTLKDMHYQYFGEAIDWLRKQRKQEFTVTLSGRRRYMKYPPPLTAPEGASEHWPSTMDEYEEYQRLDEDRKKKIAGMQLTLANHGVQGSSADVTKASEARFYQIVGVDPDIRLIMSVHDELVLEVLESEVEYAKQVLKECMEFGQRKYLKVVTIGDVEPVVVERWPSH